MKFNKKYMTFGLLGLFAMAFVTAGLITYYGQSTQTIDVISPVEFIGDATSDVEGNYAGRVLEGNELGMKNNADFSVLMQISDNSDLPKNKGIETSYVGNLELTKKDINTWALESEKMQITYTIVGDTFEVTGVPEGYTLIYYKDNDANADDTERLTVLGKSAVLSKNMPHANDWNAGELANYCDNGIDNYKHCRGAKLWAVPNENIDASGNLIWSNPENFYFETDLVEFNKEGQITVYPGETLDFTPEFDVSLLFNGSADITTTVTPVIE